MSAKNPGFILDPKNLKEKHFELVGREAIDFAFLLKENIPIPSSFVIATTAFDDFLMHTNLVGPIATSLKKVRPFIRKTAVEASAEIKNLIMAAQISDNLTRELEDAYKKLSKHNENPIVIMMQSHIIDERFTPPPSAPLQEIILQGIDDLIYQIKSAWAELFSADAIEFRANGYYHGEITVALIVQKLIRAEVSGIANSATHVSKNEIEIQAIYGIEHEKTVEFADEYIIDAKSLKVT
ncbi:partial Phosphoenolpyruvate synthase, partial [Methylococcales bacterium]